MPKLAFSRFLFFILLITVTACSKKNDTPTPVSKETSSFTYSINNVDTKTDSCTYVWQKETNNFSFNAYLNGYPKLTGTISTIPLTTGTYQVGSSVNFSYFPTISIVGYLLNGTIIITSIDQTAKIITGSFSGTCTHNNTTDVFTNGKFTMRSKY